MMIDSNVFSNVSSLYVHLPFCHRKCFYCSFTVSVDQRERHHDYIKSLIKEIKTYPSLKLQTIYFGGGTPSFLDKNCLKLLMDFIKSYHDLENEYEWSMECNPEDCTDENMQMFFDWGINRISIGAQTLSDRTLIYLDRNHKSDAVYKSFMNSRKAGFNNINLDLMFSYPNQTESEIRYDVQEIISLKSEHISLYELTIEGRSRFKTRQVKTPNAEARRDNYELILSQLKNHIEQYEVSNFSKKGWQCQHNLKYWQCYDYLGVGVGAHSYVSGERFHNTDNLFEYLKAIAVGNNIVQEKQRLSLQQRCHEAIFIGLRMNVGINLKNLEQRFEYQLEAVVLEKLEVWCEGGFLERSGDIYRVTSKGLMVLDSLAVDLI